VAAKTENLLELMAGGDWTRLATVIKDWPLITIGKKKKRKKKELK
jgi:hypothetical protein